MAKIKSNKVLPEDMVCISKEEYDSLKNLNGLIEKLNITTDYFDDKDQSGFYIFNVDVGSLSKEAAVEALLSVRAAVVSLAPALANRCIFAPKDIKGDSCISITKLCDDCSKVHELVETKNK